MHTLLPIICLFLGRRSEFLKESDQDSSDVDRGSERSDAGEMIVGQVMGMVKRNQPGWSAEEGAALSPFLCIVHNVNPKLTWSGTGSSGLRG